PAALGWGGLGLALIGEAVALPSPDRLALLPIGMLGAAALHGWRRAPPRARPGPSGRRAGRRLGLVRRQRSRRARGVHRDEPGLPAVGAGPGQPGDLRERRGRARRSAPRFSGATRVDARAG